eukprot:303008-Pyramimonas_sp.AAC.1
MSVWKTDKTEATFPSGLTGLVSPCESDDATEAIPSGLTGHASLGEVCWPPGVPGRASGLGRRRAHVPGSPAGGGSQP